MKNNKFKGVGDIVAKLASFTGADALVKSVLGEDCGCDERQELMNEMLPFKEDVVELEPEPEEEIYSKAISLAFIRDLVKHREMNTRISAEQFNLFWDIYRYYVNPRKNNSQCIKCVNSAIDEVERVLSR